LTIQATISNVTASAQAGTLAGVIGEITFQQDFSLGPNASQTITFTPANTPSLHILNPQLWWPNRYGPQNLYALQLAATVSGVISDTNNVNFGIRQISYSMAGSSNLALVVNGVPVIAKGGNWGMDEAMKRIPIERLDAEIHMHQQANYTIIRNWAGQSADDDFFNLCDQYGIMVWDEFFQIGGSTIANTNLFLDNVQETILRFRNHPSLAVWCGCNEGYPSPAVIATGDSNLIATLDPGRWYQPNSSTGSGVLSYGPYNWQPPRAYYNVDAPFKDEIGSVSIPTLEAIHAMMPSNDWETINDDWAEHDFCSGAALGDRYPFDIQGRYGPFSNLADFVRKSQLANYEAFRAIYEGRFAQLFQPVTGIITWMSNPAQPSFVWQLYSWDLEPNASLFATRKACEVVHIQMNQSNWHLMVINTTPQSLSSLTAKTSVYNLDGSLQYAHTNALTAAASTFTDLGAIAFPKGLSSVHFVKLKLFDSSNNLVSDNFYWRETVQDNFQALNTLLTVTLNIQATAQQIASNYLISVTLSNPAPVVALMTHLQLRQASSGQRVLPVFYSDNYISLLPGEAKAITLQAATANLNGDAPLLAVDGWNVTVNPSVSSGNIVGVIPNTAAQATNGIFPLTSGATRINCGGSETGFLQFGTTFTNFVSDTDFNGGNTASTTAAINTNASNAAPKAVYQTQRWGTNTYVIPATGSNIVRLHFAEVNFGPGGRQFNVAINGQQVLTNFDIAATGGEFNAVVESFIVPPNGGNTNITVAFTLGAANQPEICGIEIIPIPPPPNLSLNRPVTVSSVADGTQGSNAVDGSLNTRWGSAYSDPQWIYVDLGAAYNITEIELFWETAYGKAYQIQVSTNASTWTAIYSTTNGVGGTEYLTGFSGIGRYVRMYGTQRGTQYGYSLWEFEVFGALPTPVMATNSPQLVFTSGDGQLQFNWPTDHLGWRLEVQTNTVNFGLGTNWVTVFGSTGTNQMTFPINSGSGVTFYRLVYP
jgi:hypothetical protein